jgi:hypothetical protein
MKSKVTVLILVLTFIYALGATPGEASHKDSHLETRGNHSRHITYCIIREKGGMEVDLADINGEILSESPVYWEKENRAQKPFASLFSYDGRIHILSLRGGTGKVHKGRCFRVRTEE